MGTDTKSGENSYYCCPIKSLEFIHHVHVIKDDLFSVAGLFIPKEQIVTRHLCNYRCAFTESVLEVQGTLPLHKDLEVQVWDYDRLNFDDMIGETSIDLENRFFTRHRATIGLPRLYHVSGSNMWRDAEPPTEILNKTAKQGNLDGPEWNYEPLSLSLGGTTYALTDFGEDLCF
ncbi:hypothetical protein Pcinc_005576 [Petrolisthes cinctipes]|nr:hypothetical protein Pcinc_005576 [Petrolisthes cinctipes]